MKINREQRGGGDAKKRVDTLTTLFVKLNEARKQRKGIAKQGALARRLLAANVARCYRFAAPNKITIGQAKAADRSEKRHRRPLEDDWRQRRSVAAVVESALSLRTTLAKTNTIDIVLYRLCNC